MKIPNKKYIWSQFCTGSALILTVVLTSLLAVVGVLFVMVARVDKMATSSISENKELNFAVETVVAKIAQELVMDVPGLTDQDEEYYDYPDPNNLWLASLEPYEDEDGGDYYWRQLSDITGHATGWNSDVRVTVVGENDVIDDPNGGSDADADGDGVSDSKWTRLENLTSNKGWPIYAAVRVIDNGAMLNVNTAYKFDPGNFTVDPNDAIQMWRINLMALAGRDGDPATSEEQERLLKARANNGVDVNEYNLDEYTKNVIWRYDEPDSRYTPYDISDELELRYRFLLNHPGIDTRLEDWNYEFRNGTLSTPISSGGASLDTWFRRSCDTGIPDPNYAYRHIATTYNMDRIINPSGATLNNGSMINVNMADENLLYAGIRAGLPDIIPGSTITDVNALAAQLAVNVVDLRDVDADITTLQVDSSTYYGFEVQPFISEIGFRISNNGANNSTYNNFAIELYNPSYSEIALGDFRLELRWQSGAVTTIDNLNANVMSDESRFIITNGSNASNSFGVASLISFGGCKEDSRLELAKYRPLGTDPETYELSDRCDIYLIRSTSSGDIYVDKQETQDSWFNWNAINGNDQFYCRSEENWNIVYQELTPSSVNTLGRSNQLAGEKENYNFAFSLPYEKFITVGEVAKALIIGPGEDPCDTVGERIASEPNEELIRLDLANPAYAGIFQYLTAVDPVSDFIDNDGDGLGVDDNDNGILDVNEIDEDELKVPGRININTAPWFVVAQLPWMMPRIAQAIVTYRDTTSGGFESISELMQVPEMGYYADDAYDANDLSGFPDLTSNDGAANDFEERDVIFSRISNLATVRSDVFTAYILVRIGIDGPQKRFIAILDRSLVRSTSDKVRIIALHPVPDPR